MYHPNLRRTCKTNRPGVGTPLFRSEGVCDIDLNTSNELSPALRGTSENDVRRGAAFLFMPRAVGTEGDVSNTQILPETKTVSVPRVFSSLFLCHLQEQSVLILSERWEDLSPVISTLLGLLFPMRWPHTVIPVLPASLVHYLEAPVPFLMGMHVAGLDRVGADLSCTTIVNLVSGALVMTQVVCR